MCSSDLDLSTTVNKYLKPSLEVGSGPTKSTWMCEKRHVGTGMGCVAAAGCAVTFPLEHCWQSLHHCEMSLAKPGQTYLLAIRRRDALMPGCANEWTALKICRRNASGTKGRKTPEEVSTSNEVVPNATGMTRRDEEEMARWQSGQEGWAAARRWRSTGG